MNVRHSGVNNTSQRIDNNLTLDENLAILSSSVYRPQQHSELLINVKIKYYANVTLETRSMIRPVGTPNGVSGLKNNIADAPLRVPTVVVFFRTFV